MIPPKVTVCIPVYNGSAYIAESIESVLAQTFKDLSLIVCVNCSTDNTEEIAQSFHDPRLTYVRNERNMGLVGNQNRCLDLASGEYVCILHHDDVMLPENLEQKVHLLDEHPQVGFVHSNIMLMDSKGEVIASNIWVEDSTRDYIEDGIWVFQSFVKYMAFGSSIFIGTVLARRSCYKRLGGFSLELPHCNDSEMWMKMLLFYSVACIGLPLVKYRVHQLSASSGWGDFNSLLYIREHYLAIKMVFEKYRNHIPNRNKLKKQVALIFAERLVNLAFNALKRGEFAQGRSFVKEAISISPFVLKEKSFWKTNIGLSLGSSGKEIYQKTKRIMRKIA